MLNISCLHTAQSNIAVFEAARRSLRYDHVMLKHRVRADLLAAAERSGHPTRPILEQTAAELVAVAKGADGVLLTCSTLGEAVALAAPDIHVPVLRVDEALAIEATRQGGTVVAFCATGTTIAPTRDVFERAAIQGGATVEVRLVPGAWDLFRADKPHDYWRLIAEAVDAADDEGITTVALAQASMAGAAPLARRTPLTSPGAGLTAIVAAAQAASAETSP